MTSSVLEQVERATRLGDVAAMTRLGSQLLGGKDDSFDPRRGAELLARAAQAGGAEAAALMAVLAGAGSCRAQSWDDALDFLQQSAERGWANAQAQLALLCADRDLGQARDGTTLADPSPSAAGPRTIKEYGGLCFRGRATEGMDSRVFKGAAMTTGEGPLAADSTGRAFRWADISTPAVGGGVAIFVSPDHPGYPLAWLVRNSYAGVLNPCWPGLDGAVLAAGVPISLRYRIYIHRGDAASGRVKEAYEAYIAGRAR